MRQRAFVFCVVCAVCALCCAVGCAGSSDQTYGETRVMVNGQPVASLPDEPGEVDRLNALRDDLDQIEQELDQAPVAEDALPVLLFTLGSRLSYAAAAYQRAPDRADLKLLLARHYWLLARCQRPGASFLAFQLLGEVAQDENLDGALVAPVNLYLARIALLHGDVSRANKTFEAAQEAGASADNTPDFGLLEAKLLNAQGDQDDAKAALTKHLQRHPTDLNAKLLAMAWDANAHDQLAQASAGTVGVLVRYDLRPTHWTLTHETLGIALDLPLDWQVAEASVEADTSGVLQLVAPPHVGADRQWRSAAATVWVVPVDVGEDLDAFTKSYTESLPLQTAVSAPWDAPHHGLSQRTLDLTTDRDGEVWQGRAVLMTDGQMGYVLEVWSEEARFAQTLEQSKLLLTSFRPTSAELALQ